eukprot:12653967-Alexandrium_andersonii.AAC.1
MSTQRDRKRISCGRTGDHRCLVHLQRALAEFLELRQDPLLVVVAGRRGRRTSEKSLCGRHRGHMAATA